MIALLSDFGYQDAYVAVMKGVIATIAPTVAMCDLGHDIPPQNILAARFNLMMAYPYFPGGTVFLTVVDPGVGSARRAIALKFNNQFFVGPDNGLFGGLLSGAIAHPAKITAVELTNPRYWRAPQPSATFHGRDIFAPAAAHLAMGVSLYELGDRIDPSTLVQFDLPPFQPSPPLSTQSSATNPVLATGSVQYIDGFGNIITNIPSQAAPFEAWQIEIESHRFLSIKTYSEVPAGSMAALIGSHGWIEAVCCNGSAAAMLAQIDDIAVGTPVQLSLCDALL